MIHTFPKGIIPKQENCKTNLNVLVQLVEKWVCICEDIRSLKYAAVGKVAPQSTSIYKIFDLAEEGGVACHEGRHGVQDDMLLPLLHMKPVKVRVFRKISQIICLLTVKKRNNFET